VRLTPYGAREIAVAVALCLPAIIIFLWLGARTSFLWYAAAAMPAALLFLTLYFFRDPRREAQLDKNSILSPADGTVTHIDEVDEPCFIGGRALRISIFLSLFDVHLNRAPCAGQVVYKQARAGEFVNAGRPDSTHRNTAQDLGLETGDPRLPRILVRQIAGIIARRIVCHPDLGSRLSAGECYGMIKFGSRTELYIPATCAVRVRMRVGEHVRAGVSVLAEIIS